MEKEKTREELLCDLLQMSPQELAQHEHEVMRDRAFGHLRSTPAYQRLLATLVPERA